MGKDGKKLIEEMAKPERAIFKKVFDEIYVSYESENSLIRTAYNHPMFYGENIKNTQTKPEPLLTEEEFIEKLNSEGFDYRWNTAFQVLYDYMII